MGTATSKPCTSCIHCFIPPSGIAFARCLEPRAERTSCAGETANGFAGETRGLPTRCGPDAKWFVEKEAVAA